MSMISMIPPSPKRPIPKDPNGFANVLHAHLSLSTILLMGATLQTLLFLLPIRPVYALGPAVFLLLARFTQTMLITFRVLPNPYMKDAMPTKFSAQIPDREGNFAGPGKEKVAVLLLGTKSNHPLGIFAPDFNTVGKGLQKMNVELENGSSQETGFLGSTGFNRKDANGATELIFISYWRSLEDVHNYAHGETHREVWRWWDKKVAKKHHHIGIMHEVYEADRGMFESVYVNCQPTGLAATTYLKKDGSVSGGEEWVSPIMDASKGLLRSSNGRRGLGNSKEVEAMFTGNPYKA